MQLTPREKDKLLIAMAAEVRAQALGPRVKLKPTEGDCPDHRTRRRRRREWPSSRGQMISGAQVITRDDCMEASRDVQRRAGRSHFPRGPKLVTVHTHPLDPIRKKARPVSEVL